MTLKVAVIPALKDNYNFIIYNEAIKEAVIVDSPEEEGVMNFLSKNNLKLKYILNTHHHYDHVGCNKPIKQATKCKIMGYGEDAHRITAIDIMLKDGQIIDILGSKVQITHTPGHTLGHIVYYFIEQKWLFCGDTLFALGCGRLFEGSFQQMFDSLNKIKNLPHETKIYCAHEYTLDNAKFALTVDKDNAVLKNRYEEIKRLREKQVSTIPTNLSIELKTNPFLKANNLLEFENIRKLKDNFKIST